MRKWGVGPLAGWIASIAYQWGATINFNKANMNILEGYILAPLLMMLLEPTAGRAPMRTAGIAVVIGCLIFAGQAQYAAYTGLFALVYLILRAIFAEQGQRSRVIVQSGVPFAVGCVIGLGLSAIQLLPQLELIPLSERGIYSLDTSFYTQGLWLTPSRLFSTFIFPAYDISVDQFLPYLSTTAWVGPVAILLTGYALRFKWRQNSRQLLALLVAGLIFLYLAMGANAPLAGAITSWGPLAHFRGHGRLAGYFGLAILC